MKKIYAFAFAALAVIACNPDPEVKKDDATPSGTDTKAYTLCINEVCGVVDYKGVELYNYGDKPVSLEGWKLIKNEEVASDGTVCWTGTIGEVPAKGFQILYAKKECSKLPGAKADGKGSDNAEYNAKDSFSPGQTLKLELKDPDGKVVSTFIRQTDPASDWGTVLEPVEYSFALTQDGGNVWKLKEITMGSSNNSAAEKGDIPAVIKEGE